MRRRDTRLRTRMLAAALLAAGVIVCPVASPAVADDSIREDQWHLDAMHASELWNITKGEGVTVAVIDGGFKLDHPDLAGRFLPGKDFSGSPGGVGSYASGHGTQMASLIAGSGKSKGGQGAYGLAPGARILPLKVANGSEGQLAPTDFLNQTGQAIDFAVDQGAKVINISLGLPAYLASPGDVAKLNSVLVRAREKGALVVSSVGNSAQEGNRVEYPGALPNVVGVGAVDRNGTVTAESETGPQVTLVAPGMDMIEACTGPTGYCKSHGTSDSAALVSASAALVWSMHKDWTANQILRVLINTAGKPTDGSNRTDDAGYGAARPRIALTDPGDPGPADVSPIPVANPSPSASASPSPSVSAAASAAPTSALLPSSSPVVAPAIESKAVDKASDSGSTVPIVIAVVVGLVLVAGVVLFVVRRRSVADKPVVYESPMSPGDNSYMR
ncbi:S8 family serine peptidase [Kitasatospora aureofaciens]|uniref:S8 family serine peptidase n=1 Tax=Kitasatospora aureofaciens TaxID=1894 RepID=UPI003816186D